MSSAMHITRAPHGTYCWTQNELSSIDGDEYNLNRIKPYRGGFEIPRLFAYRDSSLKVAMPSQLVADLQNRISCVNHNLVGGHTTLERNRFALRQTMSKYEDNCVLLDLTSEDEKDLDCMQGNGLDITELLRRVPAALPKVYKDWAPHKTQLHITSDGMRILLRDSAKRVLIKAIVGNFKEDNTPNNNQGPNITSTLAMPAERHIQQPSPSTPSKRKTTDIQHRNRVIAAPSETSRPNPFKQAKIQRELFVDVKRAPSGQDANKSILDSKVYDPRSIKPVPGGFEIAFNADGFGGYSMGLSSTIIGVPSDLARRMREHAMGAANSNNTKLGNTRDDRTQARSRQFMSTWSKQEAFLLDLTSQDETQILRTNNGEVYTSVGQALRYRAPAIPMVSIYKDWDPSATAMERKADGQVLVIFKDFSGKTLMGVVIKE